MAKLREGAEAQMKVYQDAKKARDEANAASEKRMISSKPTPTAEECDLIKMGLLDLDSKEDDGSGPQQVLVTERRHMQPAPATPGYERRDVTAEQQQGAEPEGRRRR